MIFAWGFIGLAVLIGGLLLYKRKQDRKPAHTSFQCVEHVTARGEPMRFLLKPRKEPSNR
jgi:hypothetical protein